MTATPAVRIGIADSMELALARRSAAETLADLVLAWKNTVPDAVMAAARKHLAVAENWATLRREAPEAEKPVPSQLIRRLNELCSASSMTFASASANRCFERDSH